MASLIFPDKPKNQFVLFFQSSEQQQYKKTICSNIFQGYRFQIDNYNNQKQDWIYQYGIDGFLLNNLIFYAIIQVCLFVIWIIINRFVVTRWNYGIAIQKKLKQVSLKYTESAWIIMTLSVFQQLVNFEPIGFIFAIFMLGYMIYYLIKETNQEDVVSDLNYIAAKSKPNYHTINFILKKTITPIMLVFFGQSISCLIYIYFMTFISFITTTILKPLECCNYLRILADLLTFILTVSLHLSQIFILPYITDDNSDYLEMYLDSGTWFIYISVSINILYLIIFVYPFIEYLLIFAAIDQKQEKSQIELQLIDSQANRRESNDINLFATSSQVDDIPIEGISFAEMSNYYITRHFQTFLNIRRFNAQQQQQ